MLRTFSKHRGNGAIEVSYESMTAQLSALSVRHSKAPFVSSNLFYCFADVVFGSFAKTPPIAWKLAGLNESIIH